MSRVKSILKTEEIPIAEIVIKKDPTVKIDFTSSGALPIEYLTKKIYPLLEKHGYDSNKLELTCKPIGPDIDNPVIIPKGLTRNYNLNYKFTNSLVCNADNETKNEIKELIENIPYAKIKKVSFL